MNNIDFKTFVENGAFFARLLNNSIFIESKIISILSKDKLTINDLKLFYAIAYLESGKKNTVKNISDYLYVSPAACSRTINNLAKNKYVEINKSKEDKRISYITLTKKSIDIINQTNLYHVRLYNGLKKYFEQEKLVDTLEVLKVLDNIIIEQKLL